MISTTTDPLSSDWAIDDEVIRLRRWATEIVYPLPPDARGRLLVGTSPRCAIQVQDASNFASRAHASLERVEGRWLIVDQSKNGLYLDDQPRHMFLLAPGIEIGLGRNVTLIAESARSIALRGALARMIGWSAARAESVDLAIRMLRAAATGRAIFTLCGESPMVRLAEELHRFTLTEQRAFVLVNQRRQTSDGLESFTRCVPDGRTAIAQARDGTVCIDDRRRPPDMGQALDDWRRSRYAAQLIVMARTPRRAEIYTPAPVVIPPLRERRAEIERIISEYEQEARQRLGIQTLELTPGQRAWIRKWSCDTLPDIQRGTLRLIAIRHAGTVAGGATLLQLSHVALGQWLERRRFRPDIMSPAR